VSVKELVHPKMSLDKCLINLRLSHCSNLDFFNDVFHNFWAGQFRSLKKPIGRSDSLRFNQKYLNLCSKDEWKS